jgi:DNA-binding XRE family transcriptional regulator
MTNTAHPAWSSSRLDGAKLAAARIKAGYREREAFALAVGLAYTTISAYENGRRQPSWRAALKMAAVCGVAITDLLTDESPDDARPPT